jgi:hypothetical protein
MKLKTCKDCIVLPMCKKEHDDGLCQNAINEIAYKLYTNPEKLSNIRKFVYITPNPEKLFNKQSIRFIQEKLNRCRPKKVFMESIVRNLPKLIRNVEMSDFMEEIYGPNWELHRDSGDDAPGYKD